MKTLFDVIQYLIRINEKLEKGQIGIPTAKAIGLNAQVIVNAAKLELEFAKFSKSPSKLFIGENTDSDIEEAGNRNVQIINVRNPEEQSKEEVFDTIPGYEPITRGKILMKIQASSEIITKFLSWCTNTGKTLMPKGDYDYLENLYEEWLDRPLEEVTQEEIEDIKERASTSHEAHLISMEDVEIKEHAVQLESKPRVTAELLTERYLKGLCDITEQEASKFLTWLQEVKLVRTRKAFGDGSKLFKEWKEI